MKRILSLLFFIVPVLIFAQDQERTILDEDFSDNSKNWWEGDNENIKAEVIDGFYQIKHKFSEGNWNSYFNSELMHYDEYHITATIKQIEGESNDDYGISIKKSNCFLINSAKEFKIEYKGEIIKEGINEAIKGINEDNILEMIRNGKETRFLVNGNQVFSTSDYVFSGPEVGWVLYNDAQIGVNDFKIVKVPKPFKYIEDFNDNFNEWDIINAEEYVTSIMDGYYDINIFQKGYGNTFYQDLYSFSGDNSYSLETRFKVLSGGNTDGFGMYMSNDKNNEEYYFYVKSIGNYKVRYVKGEKDSLLINKKPEKNFSVSGESITLRIEHKKHFLHFYINNALVDSIRYKGFSGNRVGFIIYDKMHVQVDYLHVEVDANDINILSNAREGYKRINLGENINSENDELIPEISSDEQLIFFVREKDPSISEMWDKPNQDIFYSEKQADGTWGLAKNIGKPLNNNGSNFVISVSPDKNTLLVSNAYPLAGEAYVEGVSVSHKTKSGWAIPKKLEITNFYNNNASVSYVMSPDRKVLILALERDDSFGEKDFYVSFNTGDSLWSEPKHMGDVINTYKDEFSPFIAADSRTMYFASFGHNGYGSSDIFVTRRLDDTWINWSEPQNLGPVINSEAWDAYFRIPANGKVAYITSNDNSIGNGDIFMVTLPESAQPDPVALVTGKVLNAKTAEPIGTQIRYFDLKSNNEVGIASSAPEDGKFNITLPYGKAYSFMAEKEGFYPVSENVDLTELIEYAIIEKDLVLAPIEKGEIIRLNNIFFEINMSDLLPESYFELNRLIEILKSQENIRIEISGHSDDRGEEEYNLNLSNLRAAAVMNYLISKEIDASRLVAKGYGETKPLANNETPEGRKQNRRVEFVVLEN